MIICNYTYAAYAMDGDWVEMSDIIALNEQSQVFFIREDEGSPSCLATNLFIDSVIDNNEIIGNCSNTILLIYSAGL